MNARPVAATSDIAYADMRRIRVDGLMASTRAASSVPFMSGITTSVIAHDAADHLFVIHDEDRRHPGFSPLECKA